MKQYGVINMDIVDSRNIKHRDELLKELKIYFTQLEKKYEGIFVAPITITLGDEWQIVIDEVSEVYNIYRDIKFFLSLKLIDVYGGIGIGTITTPLSKDTREMDGEAFIKAREALNLSKKNKSFYSKALFTKDCRVALMGSYKDDIALENEIIKEVAIDSEENLNISTLEIINTLIQNNEMIESKYTQKQKEIISYYEKYESYSQIEKELNIDKSSVSRKLTTSNYYLALHNKNMISSLLRCFYKEEEGKYGV